MAAVGFEPTRTNTAGLKSAPLDQLGQTACDSFDEIYQLMWLLWDSNPRIRI